MEDPKTPKTPRFRMPVVPETGYYKMTARKTVSPKKKKLAPRNEKVIPKERKAEEEAKENENIQAKDPKPIPKKRKAPQKAEKEEEDKTGGGDGKSSDVEVTVEKRRKARDFISQCKPQDLCELLKKLTDRQKADVVSIGFGGLLSLRIDSAFPIGIVKNLVKNFNGTSRMLKFDNMSFVVTQDDICDLFLLPNKVGNDVLELDRGEYIRLSGELKEKYDIDGECLVYKVKNVIESRLVDGGDDFKRLFVIYCLSSFLTPRTNRKVDLHAIRSVIDVEKIGEYDWCSYVLKKLCTGVDKYNRNPRAKYISGCVLVLLFLYFHRLKWQGNAEPSTLPLISHWTPDKLRKRIKQESSIAVLGQGEWVNDTYPVCSRKKCTVEKEAVGKNETGGKNRAEKEKVGKNAVEEDEQDDVQVADDEYINLKLPKGKELDDDEVEKLARDNVHKAFLMCKRNFNLVTQFHMDEFRKLKNEMTQEKQEKKDTVSSPHSSISESQFFSDSKVHELIDKAVENFKLMKNLAAQMPNFELLTPEVSPEKAGEEEEDSGKQVGEEVGEEGGEEAGEEVGNEEAGEDARILDEPWPIDPKAEFKSIFMKKHKSSLKFLRRKEQDIIDYCFFNHEKIIDSNAFAHAGGSYIAFNDGIMTLHDSMMIHISIIDTWAMLLNKRPATNCFYFHAQHSIYLENLFIGHKGEDNSKNLRDCWNHWMSSGNSRDLSIVDFIFVPICYKQHYICAVINFVDGKVQYLDNLVHNEIVAPDYISLAKLVQREMRIFLKEKNHPKADDVAKYEFENVKFPWQRKIANIDCGVFLMHHMENFQGLVYSEPDLRKVGERRKLRASYCARIVLSRWNELRVQVEKEAIEFINQRS